MHGGRVEAHSAGPGQGSEFIVRLPVLAERPADVPVLEPAAGEALGPCRILVVDDNEDAAESLALLLRLGEHEVRVAYDGQTALATARTFQPEIVLLDLGLPGLSGYEVARRLRHEPDMGEMRIVALTGWGQEEDRRRTRDAGFDHHLVKPVDPDALNRLLAALVPSQT
jgi:DNA-binding response OmpR family regulator